MDRNEKLEFLRTAFDHGIDEAKQKVIYRLFYQDNNKLLIWNREDNTWDPAGNDNPANNDILIVRNGQTPMVEHEHIMPIKANEGIKEATYVAEISNKIINDKFFRNEH